MNDKQIKQADEQSIIGQADGEPMESKQADHQLEERIKGFMAAKVPESDILDKKMEEAYDKIRSMKAVKKRKLPIAVKCTTAAAMLLLVMVYCVKNPALAAQIPLIGNIFSGLEGKISIPGDYSKNAVRLPVSTDENGGDAAEGSMADGGLTDGGAAADGGKDNESNDSKDGMDNSNVTGTGKGNNDAAGTGKGNSDAAGTSKGNNNAARTGMKDNAAAADDGKEARAAGADKDRMAENNTQGDSAVGGHADKDQTASYQVESGGLTITLSEVAYDYNAIYFAMLAQSRDGFATDLLQKDLLSFTCFVKMYKADGTVKEFNYEEGTYLAYGAEGEYTDPHTFKGIAQFGGLDFDFSEYTSCELVFTEFQQMLKTGKKRKANIPVTNEEVTLIDHDIVRYKGNWTFRLDVDITEGTKQEIEVNDTNEQGYGIKKVVKTAYEMYAVPILPEGEKDYDYMITIWDADGKPLDFHGSGFNRSVYGRNVSEVTVYLLRWEDFCESKGSNTYLQPSKAIYQTKVRFEE